MDFSLTDDQELLRDTAHKLLDRECPPSAVRARFSRPMSAQRRAPGFVIGPRALA